MHYVGRRASETQPLRSMPLYRTVASVFGPSPADRVRGDLSYARKMLAREIAGYAIARAALSAANRKPLLYAGGQSGYRAYCQSQAMRLINARRPTLRAAERAVIEAERRVSELTPVDEFACGHLAVLAAERAALAPVKLAA